MSEKNEPQNKSYVKPEYAQSELTGKIIAVAQAVHHNLGLGFEEVIYQRALALELLAQGLDYGWETWIDVHYRGQVIGRKRVDFFIAGVMAEIKAKAPPEDVDVIQALSNLKASGFEIWLLLNFGAKKLEIKRLIHTPREAS